MKNNLQVLTVLKRFAEEYGEGKVVSSAKELELLLKYAEEIDELYSEDLEKVLVDQPVTYPIYPFYPVNPYYPYNPYPTTDPTAPSPWRPLEVWYTSGNLNTSTNNTKQ